MKRHWTILAAAAIGLSLTPSAQAQKSADTLRWASAFPISALDPYYNISREMVVITSQLVWDTLIYRDPASGELQPLLAKSWKWRDDTTLEFTLRDDVKWQNGKPLTAADAAYTFTYVADPSHKIPVQTNVNWIKGAEATGPHTFVLYLKAAFPPALQVLSSVLPVLPDGFYGPDGAAPKVGDAVGTGPYRITAFTPGQSIDVEATGNYFAGSAKGKPAIARIRYRTIPDNSTQIAELLSGGVDWIWNVPADQATRLGRAPGVTVKSTETMRFSYLQMNARETAKPNPLRDIRVRQAVAYALDREAILKAMVGTGARVPHSFCYITQFGCEQNVAQYSHDPARAKKLLAEAGYPNGVTLDLQAIRSRDWTTAVAGQLDAVGIKTTINFIPYAAAQQRLSRNEEQLYLVDGGWFSINDTYAVLNPNFSGDDWDAAHDPAVTDAVLAAGRSNDDATRKSLYAKALARISEQMYVLPMWTHPGIVAFSNTLEFTPFFDENPRFFLTSWKK
jgi:peptide/nickel transport system substrate-binding protein